MSLPPAELDFDALVDAHAPRLYRLLCRLLGDESEADDALQETFFRAFEALRRARFEGGSSIFTWLYRIATNAALDRLRGRRRRSAAWTALPPPAAADAAGQLEARSALRALDRLLSGLPPEQRAALVLKELEGLSNAEIAALSGTSEGAVEQRLVRARTALRARLDHD